MPHDSHWQHWHEQYAEADSALNRRLSIVRAHIVHWLEHRTPGQGRRILSLCAGDGRDVLGVLGQRPSDATTVRTVLVELDTCLADAARHRAEDQEIANVDVRTADAGNTRTYADAVPADLLLLCGIFGNVSDEDVHRFIDLTPALCAPQATVIWTRHRRPPDLTVDIRAWFAAAGFEELAFVAPDAGGFAGVGAHRLVADPRPFTPAERMFTFVGDGVPS